MTVTMVTVIVAVVAIIDLILISSTFPVSGPLFSLPVSITFWAHVSVVKANATPIAGPVPVPIPISFAHLVLVPALLFLVALLRLFSPLLYPLQADGSSRGTGPGSGHLPQAALTPLLLGLLVILVAVGVTRSAAAMTPPAIVILGRRVIAAAAAAASPSAARFRRDRIVAVLNHT